MYWGFCNTSADEAARMATKLQPQDVELFFAIVDELYDSEGVIPLMDAQNVSSQRNMPVAEKSRAIQKMNQLQWLRILRKSGEQTIVALGARALIEVPKIREWARQFAEGHAASTVDTGNIGGVDVDEMENEENEEDEEDEEEVTPARRSRRTAAKANNDEEVEDEEEVRPQSRRRLSRRR